MSPNGKGALSARHHLAHTARSTVPLAPRSDVVLAIGTRFTPPIMQNLLVNQPHTWLNAGKTVISINIDEQDLARNWTPDVGMVADAKVALAELIERVRHHNTKRPSRKDEMTALKRTIASEAAAASPQADYGLAIRAELPEDGIFFQESTQVGYWCGNFFPAYQPRTYFTSGYQGTLGYGFATALGAQAGNPDKRVVSISGDGGFFFNVQELSTMKQQDIPLTAIVFNGDAYGNVKRIQQTRFNGHVIASDLYNPDMMKLADAYGMEGHRAKDAGELRSVLRDVFARRDPVLIEVPVPPMKQMQLPPQTPLT
jgi:acetolactate synthase-1/2/3 large subunit